MAERDDRWTPQEIAEAARVFYFELAGVFALIREGSAELAEMVESPAEGRSEVNQS